MEHRPAKYRATLIAAVRFAGLTSQKEFLMLTRRPGAALPSNAACRAETGMVQGDARAERDDGLAPLDGADLADPHGR